MVESEHFYYEKYTASLSMAYWVTSLLDNP